MSFDLLFFLAAAAPNNPDQFDEWLALDNEEEITDLKSLSKSLKDWYDEVKINYPPLNGPDAVSGDSLGNLNVIDYYFSVDRIEVSIPSSAPESVVQDLLSAASKRGVGVFDPQSGSAYFPDHNGELKKIFEV